MSNYPDVKSLFEFVLSPSAILACLAWVYKIQNKCNDMIDIFAKKEELKEVSQRVEMYYNKLDNHMHETNDYLLKIMESIGELKGKGRR